MNANRWRRLSAHLFLSQDVLRPVEPRHHIRKTDGAGDHEQGLMDLLVRGSGCERPPDIAVDRPFERSAVARPS